MVGRLLHDDAHRGTGLRAGGEVNPGQEHKATWTAKQSELFAAFRLGWKPSDRRPPWQWCEDHVRVDETSPMPGKWRSDNSPWVKEPMEVFADSGVNELAIMCSAQSSKTQTIMNCMLWAVAQDPGPIQWVMAAADEAKVFARTRLIPMVKNCDAVAELLGGQEPGLTEINFPGAAFLLTGANSKSKLQSNPKRYLFLDEVRNYPPGAYEMVRKRVRAFWNSKICIISTPDKTNDHVHRAFLQGDQRRWHFACPHCGQLQQLEFKQLKWDENETTRPGGKWNFDAVAGTIRYECVGCHKPIGDTPANRKHIAAQGKWVKTNPNAPTNKVSFTWNAMLPPWVKWRDIVEEFITSFAVLKMGDHEPYKAFINETLGEPWEDRLKEFTDFGALEARRQPYALGSFQADGTFQFDKWELEKTRMLAIDVQKDHYRYVCRAIGPHGSSRLVHFGRVQTEAELDLLPAKLGVKPYNVLIDSGHETARVYRICSRNRWKAMKGTANEYFPGVDDDGNRIRRLWDVSMADPAIGTANQGRVRPIRLYLWSNPSVKDVLAEWMAGLGADWTLPQTESGSMTEYMHQVTSEKRVEKVDAKGHSFFEWIQIRRDNHYWDCECMIAVGAMAAGLIGRPEEVRPKAAAVPKTEDDGEGVAVLEENDTRP
jgi:phage terminase large subunit GpA-like protein